MSNQLIRFSRQLNFLAKELMTEKPIKKQPIILDEESERKLNTELQAYRRFLKQFLTQEGNDKLLGRLKPLFADPKSKKPIIRPLMKMKMEKTKDLKSLGEYDEINTRLTHILRRYGTPKTVDKYPSVKLLKEILNYGVVNGVKPLKVLLSRPTLMVSDFKTHGLLEGKEKAKE